MYFFYYLQNTFGESEKDCATFQTASDTWHNRLWVWTIVQQVIKEPSLNAYHCLGLCGNLYIIIRLIKQIKLDTEGGLWWKCWGGGGGLIYLSIAYSGGVLMFIHRFRRDLVSQNSCNYFLYRYHIQPSYPFHFFLHEHLWEPRSEL